MLMVALKGKKAVILLCVALVFVGAVSFGVYKFVTRNDKKSATDQGTQQLKSIIKSSRDDALAKQISDQETLEITKLLDEKKYTEIVSRASVHCPKITGKDQSACYSTYADALMGLKDFKKLDSVASEALKTEYIKNDSALTTVWTSIQKNAQAGVDPNTAGGSESE